MNHPCLFIHRLGVDLDPPAPNTMRQILSVTAADHKLDTADLLSARRHRHIVRARWDFMWRCRQVKWADGRDRYSYPVIGRMFGDMDHTTVLHGVRGWQRLLDEAQERAA